MENYNELTLASLQAEKKKLSKELKKENIGAKKREEQLEPITKKINQWKATDPRYNKLAKILASSKQSKSKKTIFNILMKPFKKKPQQTTIPLSNLQTFVEDVEYVKDEARKDEVRKDEVRKDEVRKDFKAYLSKYENIEEKYGGLTPAQQDKFWKTIDKLRKDNRIAKYVWLDDQAEVKEMFKEQKREQDAKDSLNKNDNKGKVKLLNELENTNNHNQYPKQWRDGMKVNEGKAEKATINNEASNSHTQYPKQWRDGMKFNEGKAEKATINNEASNSHTQYPKQWRDGMKFNKGFYEALTKTELHEAAVKGLTLESTMPRPSKGQSSGRRI